MTDSKSNRKMQLQSGMAPIAEVEDGLHGDMVAAIIDFASKDVRPAALHHEKDGTYPVELIATAKEMGLFGLAVPTEFGGLGLPLPVFSTIMETLAKAWTSFASHLTSHATVAYTISRHGTRAQKAALLPKMASGDLHAAILLTEEHAGSDLQAVRTKAMRQGNDFVINGAKAYISNGKNASLFLLLAQTDPAAQPPKKGLALFLVEPALHGGVTRGTPMEKMAFDCVDTCEIHFADTKVPADRLLGGTAGLGLRQLLDGLEIGRLAIASSAVGLAAAALEEATEFAKTRRAFGVTIKDHQAVRLRLAEMVADVESARAMTAHTAVKLQQGAAHNLTAIAKLCSSEAALRVTTNALRIHGGSGYIRGVIAERLFREAPLYIVGEGTNDILKLAIARDLLKD